MTLPRYLELIALFLLVAHVPLLAKAEGGCPNGQYPQSGPGWRSCVPIPGYQQDAPAQQPQGPLWLNPWQAFAIDESMGIIGKSRDAATEAEAESAALASCQRQGGTHCVSAITQVNGCIVMSAGEHTYHLKGGANMDAATQAAMSACEVDNSTCRVFTSACNLPVRIR